MKIFISRFTALLAIVLVGIIAYSLQPIEHSDIEIGESNDTLERVELSSSTESSQHFDVEGNLLVPFDIAYNELFESGEIPYEEDTILLKYPITFSGVLSRNMKTAGVESIEVLYSSVDFVWYKGIINENKDIKDVVSTARTLSEVLVVDYNYIYETAVEPLDIDFDEVQGNPSLQNQKYLKEFGIQDSWKWLTANGYEAGGSSSVVVAVIDTGVDYNHVDLAANMWVNIDEIPGNNIDDDNNGYVDDIHGVNVISDDRFENGNPMDDHGHGTHVAGIIAAANNKEGVVGVAYNSKIMAIKAGQASGFFTQADIAEAILYAYDNGADVINMSFGGSGTSIAVQDALMTAYTRSVLVASAGNSGLPNEYVPGWIPVPNYPAAYSYVIGVMSVNNNGVESPFTNWDVKAYNTIEYEVYAPGEQILSTLPNDRYAAWSGTSMAAPVVSGIAALARSVYSDRDMYPNKFIMGQIVSTSETSASCLNPNAHGLHNIPNTVDALAALTKLPKPEISLYDYLLYDSEEISESNNGDGIIDAGETIDLGLILRNKWGMSKDTIVTIDSISTGGVPNPYVTFITDEVNFEGVGTYSTKDLLSRDGSIVTGVETPHRIIIDSNTPNDYIIVINITGTSMNGLDPDDTETYDFKDKIYLTVRNGMILPNIVEEDMTLTNDNYYIIPNSMIIKEGATVIVEPGTKIQFWTDDPNDAYADTAITYLKVEGEFITQGTVDAPVELFPSELMSTYRVEIFESDKGFVSLNNTEVTNGHLEISEANRVLFKQNYLTALYYRYLDSGVVKNNYGGALYDIEDVNESIFYVLGSNRSYYLPRLKANVKKSIFASSAIHFENSTFEDCVFLKNNTLDYNSDFVSNIKLLMHDDIYFTDFHYNPDTGATYALLQLERLSSYMNIYDDTFFSSISDFPALFGGSFAIVNDADEYNFLKSKYNYDSFFVGLIHNSRQELKWIDGSDDVSFIEENYNYDGSVIYEGYVQLTGMKLVSNNYSSRYMLVEFPGDIYISTIDISDSLVEIDMESTYKINTTLNPITADKGELVYVSSDDTIVSVDENGLVTPNSFGEAFVYVYSSDYQTEAKLEVRVVEKIEIQDLFISVENNQLSVDDTSKINVELYPSDTTQRFLNFSSLNSEIVSVTETGEIEAVGIGTTTLIVENFDGSIVKEIDITVVKPVASLKFEESIYMTSISQETDDFLPNILPIDATNKTLVWESSNPEVAYVDENNNLVKIMNGVTTIKATIENTNLSAELVVSVTDSDSTGDVSELLQISDYFFALFSDGNIYQWGKDILSPRKLELPVDDSIIDFTYSNGVLITLKDDKTIRTYSLSSYLSDGDSSVILEISYKNLDQLQNVVKIEQTHYYNSIFFLKEDGSVWSYGSNTYGELGDGTKTYRDELVQTLMSDIKDIAAGYSFVAFLDNSGDMYVSGGYYSKYTTPHYAYSDVVNIQSVDNFYVSVQDSTSSYYLDFYSSNLTNKNNAWQQSNNYIEYSLNSNYGYFKNTDNGIYTSGSNDFGEMGTTSSDRIMKKIFSAKRIFSFRDTTFVQTEDGKFYGMGKNANYELANFSTENSYVPSRIFFGLQGNTTVFSVEEDNLDNNLLFDQEIIIDFNEALVTSENYVYVKLLDSANQNLAVIKKLDMDKFTIKPFSNWIIGETYTLEIPSGSITTKFMKPNELISYTFTYTGDQTSIECISQSIPNEHSTTDNNISIKVDYTIANRGLEFDNISVVNIYDQSQQMIDVSIIDNSVSINGYLDFGNYKLTIPSGALIDNVGGSNELLEINFNIVDALRIIDMTHENLSERHQVDDSIQITYSNATEYTNFNSIALYDSLMNQVIVNIELIDNVMTIDPIDALDIGSNYTLVIPEDAVVDVLNNTNEAEVIKFKTYEALELIDTSIEHGEVNVNPSQEIVLYFNFANEGANFDSIQVVDTDLNPIDFGVSLFYGQLHFELDALYNQEYTLIVPSNALIDELGVGNTYIEIAFSTIHKIERFHYTFDYLNDEFNKYVEAGKNSIIKNSAILNNFNDTNVEHWLRFVADDGTQESYHVDTIGLGGNFWGTTDLELINKQILDFDDYQSMYNINEGIILTTAPENTFPFVTNVEVINSAGESVQKVGNETIQVVVEFNRDMDMTVPLDVRFGSSLPYAEYQIEGTYENPRKWVGIYTLTTVIENGNQFFSITNGHAVEDSWFSLQPDRARFTFEIDTTGAQALIMQGVSTETGIELNWTQDDFETLAGYNVYRSTSEDGYYQRLNDVVIPSSVKTFFDDTVEPGVIYYYNFTVVKTDLTESIPSGKIVIQSLDTMAPNIYHSPVYQTLTGHNLVISASITDNLFVNSAYLHYRTIGDTEWNTVSMTNNNDKYSGVIISEDITLDGLEYYISASDGITVTYNRTSENPYQVIVKQSIDSSKLGDINDDGQITILDALMHLQATNDQLNLTADEFLRADLDGNGQLEAWEALRILQYVSGKVTTIK